MSEHFPVSAREQSNDYCRSPEYFRSLDTPLPLEDVAKLRRLHEPVRYSEDGRRRIPIEKEYSDLYKLIYESSLRDNDDELQRFRAMSAEYALRTVQLSDDEHSAAMRHAILSELATELPAYGEDGIDGLRRYEYPGDAPSVMLDGMCIENLGEVYKEIIPRVIRPSDTQWRHVAVDASPVAEATTAEVYDNSPLIIQPVEEFLGSDDDEEPVLESNEGVIGYETFHNAKLATLRFSVRALTAVTGQIEKIEHLLKTAA